MANANIPRGGEVFRPDLYAPERWLVNDAETTKHGDTLFLNSSGEATATDGVILGLQVGRIRNGYTGDVISDDTADADRGDYAMVYTDPYTVFSIQLSTGAATDPYTTRATGACFDIAGSTGVEYVDVAASTNDTIKVLGIAPEPSSGGALSATGAYQKKYCQYNPAKHFRGPYA
jgi:hypothetical protein